MPFQIGEVENNVARVHLMASIESLGNSSPFFDPVVNCTLKIDDFKDNIKYENEGR